MRIICLLNKNQKNKTLNVSAEGRSDDSQFLSEKKGLKEAESKESIKKDETVQMALKLYKLCNIVQNRFKAL